jgi:hypothetical protein
VPALALAVGRGDTPLARLRGCASVRAKDVALIAARAELRMARRRFPILDISGAALSERAHDVAAATSNGSYYLYERGTAWVLIHLDADVINLTVMPAVDSPPPAGRQSRNCGSLTPLARHPPSARPGSLSTIPDRPDRSCHQASVVAGECSLSSLAWTEGGMIAEYTGMVPISKAMNTWASCARLRCPGIGNPGNRGAWGLQRTDADVTHSRC